MIILFLLILLVLAFVSSPVTAAFAGIVAILFFYITRRLTNKVYPNTFRVYLLGFIVCLAFAVMCLWYMHAHGYTYLLIYDTNNYFLPITQYYLDGSSSLKDLIVNVWSEYSFFDRFQTGYFTHLAIWGYFSKLFGADLYFVLQLSHCVINSFIPVLLYRILIILGINDEKSVKYALIIFCSSILFFYSTVIFRDSLIAVLILFIFYISLHELSVRNVAFMGVSIFLISTMRIETGLLCSIFIPSYFYIWRDKTKKSLWPIAIILLVFAGVFVLYRYINKFISVYQFVDDTYVEGVQEGAGIIAMLQRIPILKYPLSCIFTALQPIPCWVKMSPSASLSRVECYNIMHFPEAISAFFDFYIIIYLFMYIIEKRRSQSNTLHNIYILLIPGLFFLFIQAAVVEKRRIMSIYFLFYIIWAIKHSEMPTDVNKKYLNTSIVLFLVVQLVFGIPRLL